MKDYEKLPSYPFLSNKARHILQTNVDSQNQLYALSYDDLLSFWSCGRKTAKEIEIFIRKSKDNSTAIINIEKKADIDDLCNEEFFKNMLPKAKKFIEELRCSKEIFFSTDLFTHKDNLTAKVLHQLGRFKKMLLLRDRGLNESEVHTSIKKVDLNEESIIDMYRTYPDVVVISLMTNVPLKNIKFFFPNNIDDICKKNNRKTICDELDIMFHMDTRSRDIVRKLMKNITLEEIGYLYKISRQRVDQIDKRAKKMVELSFKFGYQYFDYLNEFCSKIIHIGSSLNESNIKELLPGDYFYDFMYLSRIICENSNSIHMKSKFVHMARLVNSIPVNSSLSIREMDAIKDSLNAPIRKIKKIVRLNGAIEVREAASILDLSIEEAQHVLSELAFTEICDGWYHNLGEKKTRYPFFNAIKKVLSVRRSVKVEKAYFAIARHCKRTGGVLIPLRVFISILKAYKFQLIDDEIIRPKNMKARLAETEKLFIRLLRENGDVLTFQDLYKGFKESSLSIHSLTLHLLPNSPLVEKIDWAMSRNKFYTLIGNEVTYDSLIKAEKRVFSTEVKTELIRTFDGYEIITQLNSFSISGTISISNLPDIGSEWCVNGSNETINIGMNDHSIWGFSKLIRKEGFDIGDIIKISFNITTRKICIKKVESYE